MSENLESYRASLESFYKSGTSNHLEHNENPDYFDVLLKEVTSAPKNWEDKVALDFGCGKGRNVVNLFDLAKWKKVDGVDISKDNINYCNENYKDLKSTFYKNSGSDLSDISSNFYDFVMSTIVFQHIPVREVRVNLKKEIYRTLKCGGIFSFQMGHGKQILKSKNHSSYLDNAYSANGSNGMCDVQITPETEKDLIKDLEEIGFENIEFFVKPSFSDDSHENWIYVSCKK
jgi:SAM-dependent methyltransferase